LLTLTKSGTGSLQKWRKLNWQPASEKLGELEDWTRQKNITIDLQLDDTVSLHISPFLADLMLDNLLGNAIKHNIEKGFIKITLKAHQLSITNSARI
jgi:signal transduction histidine kinase